jgi:HlyD family secretion protein
MTFKRLGYLVLSVSAVAAAVVGLIYLLNNRPLVVKIAAVESSIQVQVFGLGTVEAQVISDIGFELSATLVELTADHGSIVRRGDVLARLEASEQQSRVKRAEAGVQTAGAALVRTASMIERQAAVLAQKEDANKRQQDLLGKGVASVEKAEETNRDLMVAKADHALAVADAEVARAALDSAHANLALEMAMLEHHTLKAPFDALVVERQADLGRVVKAGDPVYTIVDAASVWVLAHIEEARAGAIAVGQPAEVRLRSLPGTVFPGQVVRIGIESDRVSEERRVWVKCLECPADFHLGEQAEVIINVAVLSKAVLVPELMVVGYDGHAGSVWVAENGAARQVGATFGHRTLDGRIEVTGGVPQGSDIITGPSKGLKEGRAVRVSTATPP